MIILMVVALAVIANRRLRGAAARAERELSDPDLRAAARERPGRVLPARPSL